MMATLKNEASLGRLESLIKRFRRRRIAVVGDWMLDRYIWGTATRLSPEAAVPIVDYTKESECLGGAGNVAANLCCARRARGGVWSGGRGRGGGGAASLLARAEIFGEGNCSRQPRRPTTLKTRIIARNQQIVRVDRESREPLDATLRKNLAD